MDRKEVYLKTKNLIRGHLKRMVFGLILIFLLISSMNFVLDKLFPTIDTDLSVLESIKDINRVQLFYKLRVNKPYSFFIIKEFISFTFSYFLNGAFSIAILEFVRSNIEAKKPFYVENIFISIKIYGNQLLLISVLTSTITLFFSLIPIVGDFFQILFSLFLIFVVYLIVDYPEAGPFYIFKKSFEKTKGHKLDLALVYLKYLLFPTLLLVGSFITLLVLFVKIQDDFKFYSYLLFTYLSIIIAGVLLVRNTIYLNVALAEIYDNINWINKTPKSN